MMKKRIGLLLMLCVLAALSGCGCDDGKDVDLVFLNESNRDIAAVSVETESSSEGARYADCSPFRPGESFGFEVGEYPATVAVYADPDCRKELARLTISEAPAAGERWCVAARDGKNGLELTWDEL